MKDYYGFIVESPLTNWKIVFNTFNNVMSVCNFNLKKKYWAIL